MPLGPRWSMSVCDFMLIAFLWEPSRMSVCTAAVTIPSTCGSNNPVRISPDFYGAASNIDAIIFEDKH